MIYFEFRRIIAAFDQQYVKKITVYSGALDKVMLGITKKCKNTCELLLEK